MGIFDGSHCCNLEHKMGFAPVSLFLPNACGISKDISDSLAGPQGHEKLSLNKRHNFRGKQAKC